MATEAFIQSLKTSEGYADLVPDRKHSQTTSSHGAYYDPEGNLTTGYGALISEAEAGSDKETADIAAFQEKYNINPFTLTGTQANTLLVDVFIPIYEEEAEDFISDHEINNLSSPQKEAITEMLYNMGRSSLNGFTQMIQALKDGNIANIEAEAKDSGWFRDDVAESRSLPIIEKLKNVNVAEETTSEGEAPLTPQQLKAMGEQQSKDKQAATMRLKASQISINYPEESDVDREVAEFQAGQEEVTEATELRRAEDVRYKDNEELASLSNALQLRLEAKELAKQKSLEDVGDVNMEDSLSDNKGSFYDQKVKEAKARNEARNKESLRVQNIRKLSKMGELGIRG